MMRRTGKRSEKIFLDFSKLDIVVILVGLFIVAPATHFAWLQYKDGGKRRCLSVGDTVPNRIEAYDGESEIAAMCLAKQNMQVGRAFFYYDGALHYRCDVLSRMDKPMLLACIAKEKDGKT